MTINGHKQNKFLKKITIKNGPTHQLKQTIKNDFCMGLATKDIYKGKIVTAESQLG